jgi:predicted RND superfamily exporter protein
VVEAPELAPVPESALPVISRLLAYRMPALGLVALLTGLLGWAAWHLQVDPGVESMIPLAGGELERLRAFQRVFGSDEVVVLALHSDRLFARDTLERVDQLTQRVAALPRVARVLSPTNVRDLEGDALGPVPIVPYAAVRSGTLAPEQLGRQLGVHPIFGGLLVARDARTAAILVELEPVAGDPTAHRDVVTALRRLAREAGSDLTAFVAGILVEKTDVSAAIARDQRIFIPLVFLILAAMTALLYRHPVGMLVPLAVVGLTLLWTLGLYGLAGRLLNPVTSLMTPVIMVMSLEAVIQLLNQYLAARADGLSRPDALTRADRRMRIPCFNAALTAAIGFVSLLTLPIPAIRDFGLFTALGLMIGYGLTVTLTPLLLASLPDVPPRVIRAFEPGPIERTLARVVRGVARHRWLTAITVGALMVVSLAGVLQIRVETDLVRSLRHASPLSAAARFIDAQLTGVNAVEILIGGISPRDPEALGRLARFEDDVRGLPHVRKVTGLPDLLVRVNRAVHQGNDAYARLPDGPDAAADLDDFRRRWARRRRRISVASWRTAGTGPRHSASSPGSRPSIRHARRRCSGRSGRRHTVRVSWMWG